jgi:two-component system, OmpR family, phosphate regulon response regulator PhoB
VTVRPAILVADDDRDILELVALRLERAGYAILRAVDGEEALRVALHARPALVVLDAGMPKMSGLEVLRELRRREATRGLPVVMLSARAQEADVARALAAGVDRYVKKPFSPHELHGCVQTLLARAGAPEPTAPSPQAA